MPLFLAKNQRDDGMIDIFTKNRNGDPCVWAIAYADLLNDAAPPHGIDEHFADNDAPELECVLITKESYDMLCEIEQAMLESRFPACSTCGEHHDPELIDGHPACEPF